MPSPFPGMDPYLEDPATWPNLHTNLMTAIQQRLTEELRPRYYARVEERVYVSDQNDPARAIYVPDVRIVAAPHGDTLDWTPREGGLAVAEPLECTTLIEDEIHERRVEIVAAADRSVVTVIEVLSPANKVAGSAGMGSFRNKRFEVTNSTSHWVEIDLLRFGQNPLPPPLHPRGDYFVHVSRVERRPKGRVWPIRLPQRLPVVGVPLKAGDPDYPLDLQAILTTAYDRSAYDLEIDYAREPHWPLTGEQAAWSDRLLRDKGLRAANP